MQEIVVRAEVRRGIMDGGLENIPFCPRNLSTSTVCRADGRMRAHLHLQAGTPGRRLILGEEPNMSDILRRFWWEDEGQDIAEYAVMLAVILVIVVGTIRLIGGNANNVFSSVASSIQ
jgi:Flp pilus assembly pilin Flp